MGSIGTLQRLLKGSLHGVHNETIRILVRILRWFYRDSLRKLREGVTWIIYRIRWTSKNLIWALLEGSWKEFQRSMKGLL